MMAGTGLAPFASATPESAADQLSEPLSGQTAMVGLAGALGGMTIIGCSAQTAVKLGSKMAGNEAAKDPTLVSDALGELCNMVTGNFKAKIITLADHCMLRVPTVISGENYVMQSAEPSEPIRVPLLFEGSQICVSLIIQS